MKTPFKKLAIVAMTSLSMSGWAIASTTLSFPDQTTLNTEFPTTDTSGMYSGPTATTNIHGQDVVELIAGDLTLLDANRQGRLTLYSTNTYSSGLDFITTQGLSLTFSNARLDTPRGTTWGKIGITSANTGAMKDNDGIYLIFHRAGTFSNNSIELRQTLNGTETSLVTLISGGVGSMFDAQAFSLNVTATNWSMTLISQNNSGDPTMTNTASGIFGTAWTTTNWGLNTYLGIEAYQNQTGADTNTRYAQFSVESIQFEQIPEPTSIALLLGVGLVALVGARYRKK